MAFCAVACALDVRSAMASPFMLIFAVGFFYVSILTFQGLSAPAKRPAASATEPEA